MARPTQPTNSKRFRIVIVMRVNGTRAIFAPTIKTAALARRRMQGATSNGFRNKIGRPLRFQSPSFAVQEEHIVYTRTAHRTKLDTAAAQNFPHRLARHLELRGDFRDRSTSLVKYGGAIEVLASSGHDVGISKGWQQVKPVARQSVVYVTTGVKGIFRGAQDDRAATGHPSKGIGKAPVEESTYPLLYPG